MSRVIRNDSIVEVLLVLAAIRWWRKTPVPAATLLFPRMMDPSRSLVGRGADNISPTIVPVRAGGQADVEPGLFGFREKMNLIVASNAARALTRSFGTSGDVTVG
jgi:hypothetical protein